MPDTNNLKQFGPFRLTARSTAMAVVGIAILFSVILLIFMVSRLNERMNAQTVAEHKLQSGDVPAVVRSGESLPESVTPREVQANKGLPPVRLTCYAGGIHVPLLDEIVAPEDRLSIYAGGRVFLKRKNGTQVTLTRSSCMIDSANVSLDNPAPGETDPDEINHEHHSDPKTTSTTK